MSGGSWGCGRCGATWLENPVLNVDCPFGGCGAQAGEPCDTRRPSGAHAARHRASDVSPCPGTSIEGALHNLRPVPDQREAFA